MLEFNKDRHEYKYNGVVLPSVSEIMKPLAEDYYSKVLKFNDLSEASNYGSGVHKAIEYYISFGLVSVEYPKEVMAFIQFLKDENLEVLYSERQLTNGVFCGTIDLVCKHNESKKIFLVDIKATSVIAEPLLEVQLCAYEELLTYVGIYVDGTYVLHLKKTGTYKFKPIAINRRKWGALYGNWKKNQSNSDTV